MHIAVVTLFPEMFGAIADYGVSGRAVERGLLKLKSFNPRDYTEDRHQTVDDRPYGGGPGMVMMVEPLRRAVNAAQRWLEEEINSAGKVVYLSPQGLQLSQALVRSEAQPQQGIIFVAGRYEGVDERFIEAHVDEEWSIGDYVLSGGELPAMVAIDAITRLLPGVLGDELSAEQDSFGDGLLDCPHYTRPFDFAGEKVPEVLVSGDHKRISRWRMQQSLLRTKERRPELLDRLQLSEEQQALLDQGLSEQDANKQ